MARPVYDQKQLGFRIKNRRAFQGLSQQQLADMTGISRSSLAQYETGRNSVPNSELAHLAEVLDVTVGYFFGDALSDAEANQFEQALDMVEASLSVLEPQIRRMVLAALIQKAAWYMLDNKRDSEADLASYRQNLTVEKLIEFVNPSQRRFVQPAGGWQAWTWNPPGEQDTLDAEIAENPESSESPFRS